MSAIFELPEIIENPHGWGPVLGNDDDIFQDWGQYTVEQITKYPSQKLGRVCDFTQTTQDRNRKQDEMKKKNNQASSIIPAEQEDGYSLVDNRPQANKNSYFRSKGQRGGFRGGKGGFGFMGKGGKKGGFRQAQVANYQEGILGQKPKTYYSNPQQPRGKGMQFGGYRRFNNRNTVPSFRDWSVTTSPDWLVRQEIMLTDLSKVRIDAKLVVKEDIVWAGQLGTYDNSLDRLNVKAEKRLERFEDVKFFNVSTSDDPVMQHLIEKNSADYQVAATDQILAVLMAARSSVYSWDIIITKVDGKIMFDKRDGSHIDFLTVGETSNDPPSNEDKDAMNAPMKLGQEATCINQNFSQMVLDQSIEPIEMEPNPFDDGDESSRVACVGYRYRKITLPGNEKDEDVSKSKPINILVRTEVNAKLPDNQAGYCCVRALNEYDSKLSSLPWKTHLETQRGAVLAGELKNNAFKLGRFTAEALISGCETMKIGYATRTGKDNWSHNLLNVQTYQTSAFSQNIGITEANGYGIIRSICDIMSGFEDGKYLLLKDPTKPVMRLYELPWDAFESESEDEMDAHSS